MESILKTGEWEDWQVELVEKLEQDSDVKKLQNLIMEQNSTMIRLLSISEDIKEQNLRLRKFASHKDECHFWGDYSGECTCGLEKELKDNWEDKNES